MRTCLLGEQLVAGDLGENESVAGAGDLGGDLDALHHREVTGDDAGIGVDQGAPQVGSFRRHEVANRLLVDVGALEAVVDQTLLDQLRWPLAIALVLMATAKKNTASATLRKVFIGLRAPRGVRLGTLRFVAGLLFHDAYQAGSPGSKPLGKSDLSAERSICCQLAGEHLVSR